VIRIMNEDKLSEDKSILNEDKLLVSELGLFRR
jgi:hypothetical protein